jgi:hypothetical protein
MPSPSALDQNRGLGLLLLLSPAQLRRHAETQGAAVISILAGFAWAACFALSDDLLRYPSYHLFGDLLSRVAWSLDFLAIAALQLLRLSARPGRLYPLDLALKFAAMVNWTLVAALCVRGPSPREAVAASLVTVAFAAWWDFLRSSPHARATPGWQRPPRPHGGLDA